MKTQRGRQARGVAATGQQDRHKRMKRTRAYSNGMKTQRGRQARGVAATRQQDKQKRDETHKGVQQRHEDAKGRQARGVAATGQQGRHKRMKRTRAYSNGMKTQRGDRHEALCQQSRNNKASHGKKRPIFAKYGLIYRIGFTFLFSLFYIPLPQK